MLIDRTIRLIYSISVLISFLIASYIIIPDNFLKNFNIVSIRLREIFSSTILSNLSLNAFVYLFTGLLLIFSYYIYRDLFTNLSKPNRIKVFLIQELKFSTSLIVIFWVLKILDFSRLTILTSSAIRFLFVLFILKIYDLFKTKYESKDVLLITLDNKLDSHNLTSMPGVVIKKIINNMDDQNIINELNTTPYDELWITGSNTASPEKINNLINKIIEYGLSVKVDNLLDIKTTITPSFEIINGKNYISYTTSYLESSMYFYKRIFDILFTLLVSVVLLPVSIFVTFYILIDSGFPILFKQTRGGLNSKEFTIYKFRTMKKDAEQERADLLDKNDLDGIGFKLHDDPRVTRSGMFLRKFSIDEIPQFINVVKGDMSIVGPRPAVFDEIDRYEIWHRRRLSVRPGITGPWQLTDRLTTDFDERIRLDLNYIDNQSFINDILIILRTPFAMIKNKSA